MRHPKNIFRSILTLILVFQVSIAYALPEGIHLNLCFGSDGQFEISPDLCRKDLPGQGSCHEEAFIPSDSHRHDDCVEFELGCISAGELRRSSSNNSTIKNKYGKTPSSDINHLFYRQFNNINNYQHVLQLNNMHENLQRLNSFHLTSLRTVILII